MTICAIAVGVYSATTASVTASGKVAFTAHNCKIEAGGYIYGHGATLTDGVYVDDADGLPVPSSSPVEFETVTIDGTVNSGMTGIIDIGSTRYFTDMETGVPEDIVIVISVTNISDYDVTVTTNLNDVTKPEQVTVTFTGENSEIIANGETVTFKYTLTLNPTSSGSSSAVYDNLDLSDIGIPIIATKFVRPNGTHMVKVTTANMIEDIPNIYYMNDGNTTQNSLKLNGKTTFFVSGTVQLGYSFGTTPTPSYVEIATSPNVYQIKSQTTKQSFTFDVITITEDTSISIMFTTTTFTFSDGTYATATVTDLNGNLFVMPEGVENDANYATEPSETTKYSSVIVNGVTVNCQVFKTFSSDGETEYIEGKQFYQYYPVFKDVVSIKDAGITYDERTTTMPNDFGAIGKVYNKNMDLIPPEQIFQDGLPVPEGDTLVWGASNEPIIPTESEDSLHSSSGINYLVYCSDLSSQVAQMGDYVTYVIYKFRANSGQEYYYIVAYYVSQRASCITAETLITLADGSQKMAKDLTGDEQLLTLNHTTGKLEATKIAYIVNHGEYANFKIIKLNFSNGSSVEMYAEHVFYDVTLNKYVAINTNPEQYVGHEFIALAGTSMQTVTLESVTYETKYTSLYEVVTYQHLTCFTENILSTSAYLDKLLNIFEIEQDTYAYNSQKVAEDIQTYGTYAYEDFKDLISEEAFELYNAKYLKIAVGKGYITWQDILNLIDIYFNVDVKPLN